MITPRKCTNSESMIRLWLHEIQRVFCDRLINTVDSNWFLSQIHDLSIRHLKNPLTYEECFTKSIIFTDFFKPEVHPRLYEEVKDTNRLNVILNEFLDTYNLSNPTQMNLVFFRDAMEHITRITRILRQPRGQKHTLRFS